MDDDDRDDDDDDDKYTFFYIKFPAERQTLNPVWQEVYVVQPTE